MAANDYLIPVGIDPAKFFAGLNAMDAGTDRLNQTVKDAAGKMSTSFASIGSTVDALGKKLDVDATKLLTLKETARTVQDSFKNAFSAGGIGKDLENRITTINAKLQEAGKKGIKIPFEFDQAKLQLLEQMIAGGADEFKVLNQVVDISRQKLATLNPDSAEFQQLSVQIQTAEEFLKAFGETSDQVNNKQKSLKAQLREMKAALAEMELAGDGDTKKFFEMSVAAGRLEDQIGDVSQRVRVLASDTRFIDAGVQAVTALTGAFTAGQGALAVFGNENKTFNEIIQKTTGAMALLQGVQAVATALNKDSALSVLFFSKAQNAATVATAELAATEVAETGATVAATAATKAWTATLLANPIFLVLAAITAVVVALIAFTSGTDDAEKAANKLNDTLDRQNKLLKLDDEGIKRRTDLLVAEAKKRGETESNITKLEGQALAERINNRIDNLKETRALLNDQNFTEKLSAEDFKKLQDKELEQSSEVENLKNDLKVKRIEFDTQKDKEAKELSKKRIEDAKKEAAQQKAILDQQIKFRRDFQQAYIDSILDQYDKERETAKANIENRIADLQREKSLSKKAEQEKNDLIVILRQNLTQQLRDIDQKREADRAVLLFQGQQKLAELSKDSTDKEIQISQLSYQEKVKQINEQFKNEGALRVKLLAALKDQQAREEKKIRDDAAIKSNQDLEEREVLEVETASKFIHGLPFVEEQKQIEVLKVKIKYAQKALELLLAQGNAENSTVVLQAKKQVQDLQNSLIDATADLSTKTNKFDFFKLLGLDSATGDQKEALTAAFKSSLDSIHEITDFIVDQFQRQIDKKQEVIDQDNKALDDLEKQLDEEKSLRDRGLANNVANIQAEIDAKKKARDEEIKQQQELQEKQKGVQRAQLALDTAVQFSNLATSATNIYKSLSPLGPIGIGIAIGTIALMLGAFAAAKVKAFQSINDGNKQTLGKGGRITDGKPHSQGGKKYIAVDGTGDIVEVEQGEHVTRKEQVAKYGELLDAINNDSLKGMTDEALREMLHSMGIHLTDERETVQIFREKEALRLGSPGNDITELKSINRNVSFLAEKERERVERWEDTKFYYERRGTKVNKEKK
jgi:hypothetical protein